MDNFWIINEVSIPFVAELSAYRGVTFGGCGCPSFMILTCMGHARCRVINMPPVLHSAAVAMMVLIVRHMM